MKKATTTRTKRVKKSQYPKGWDEKRVKAVIEFYDNQTEDEELAEYEAAMELKGQSMMLVPTELVPEIRKLSASKK
jgi:uncharacterized protein (UPF0335 family)